MNEVRFETMTSTQFKAVSNIVLEGARTLDILHYKTQDFDSENIVLVTDLTKAFFPMVTFCEVR
jgi:hypothetical protein